MILRGLYGVWIIDCVACLIAFMSMFFSLEKLFLKACSTPPRHLAYLSSSSASFYRNLDTSSTPGGSIEKVLVSSIASQQLGRSIELLLLIWWFVPRHMLDTCICRRPFSWHLPRQISWHFSTPSSIKIYWWPICSLRAIRISFLSISLSIPLTFHLLNLFHSLQTSSSRFLQAFSRFSSLGKLLISHIHAFHVLKPRIWGFWKILGFSKIDELLLKCWDRFLLKWV